MEGSAILCQKCGNNKFKVEKTMKIETMDGVLCAAHVETSICANIHCQAHTFTEEQSKQYRAAILKEYKRKKKD